MWYLQVSKRIYGHIKFMWSYMAFKFATNISQPVCSYNTLVFVECSKLDHNYYGAKNIFIIDNTIPRQ